MLKMQQALPMDHPNYRSLHQQPVPRSGGVGIMLGLAVGWTILWPSPLMTVLGLALALTALSLADDFLGLSRSLRLCLQLAAAAVLLALQPAWSDGFWTAAAAALAVAWMTNVFNFMDGANGLAGGMALFGFGFYAVAAGLAGAPALSAAALCVAMAAVGFLWFNFDPAKIFMGDVGSIPLGFLAAALGLAGWREGVWPLGLPLLVFSPFIVDATATMALRMVRGEKFWQAHRDHYYQRLIRLGLGHRRVALAEYGVMLACGLSALVLQSAPLAVQIAILSVWCVLYGLAMLAVDRIWGQHTAHSSP
jgi:UDP-N-acetylmuramyl pentapeptide phosphotransferase/UDP-N-acetylglucosamine-1-phosphate transferase